MLLDPLKEDQVCYASNFIVTRDVIHAGCSPPLKLESPGGLALIQPPPALGQWGLYT